MDGIGCNEDVLSRIIGGFDKKDARKIAARYKEKYDQDLLVRLKEETGGNFE